MLNLEDHIKGHQFFRQAAEIAVTVNKQREHEENKTVCFYYIDLYSSI